MRLRSPKNLEATYTDQADGNDKTFTINGGSRVVLTAVPVYGYVFDYWLINETDIVYDRIYVIEQLGKDIEAVASSNRF